MHERAKSLESTGALSEATINQYVTAERTARARLDAQRAGVQARQLKVAQTPVLAPDSGVISSRSATVGAVLPAGQELFRMIRQGRLEWRAEVASSDMALIKPGVHVTVTPAGGTPTAGTVRMVAPTVDPQTRNGIVYVDLPAPGSARAGMFARGEFDIGNSSALTLPQSAVQLRDGFSYVFKVGADNKVTQVKIEVGRRVGDRIEVTRGLEPDARVVATGGAFLAEGDTVRIVDAPAAMSAAPASAGPARARARPSHDQRLVLVDQEPHSRGPSLHHAHGRRHDELQGDEGPELPRHRPADGHRHGVAAGRLAVAARDRRRAQDREPGRDAARHQAHLHLGAGRRLDDDGRVPAREADAGSGR